MSKWTRFRDKLAKKIMELLGIKPDPEPQPPEPQPEPTPEGTKIVWRYGGFRGENAAEDPVNVIRDLHIKGKRLTFGWERGDLSNWGVGKTDATAIAAAFFWSDEEQAWIGGKFEWVDFSRTTRDLANIYPGPDGKAYHGWRSDLFLAAPKRAFCIVKKDGSLRTNLIETTEK